MALTVMGNTGPEHWQVQPQKASLTTLTREAERIQAWLGFQGELVPCEHEEFDYGLELVYQNQKILRYGKVASKISSQYELRQEVFHMAIDWPKLVENIFLGKKFNINPFRCIPVYDAISAC